MTTSLTERGAHEFVQADWPVSSRDTPVSASPVLETRATMPRFLGGFWGCERVFVRQALYWEHPAPGVLVLQV